MKEKNIKMGFEIECILNSEGVRIFEENIGSYHEGVDISNYYEIQSDSSIYGEEKFEEELEAEFVTRVLTSKEDFFNAVEDFKNIIGSGGKVSLKNNCYFNNSCGCHIHFSQGTRYFKDLIPHKYLINMRNLFFKELETSTIIPKETKEKIKNHYFRRYATKSTKQVYINSYLRNTEFNSVSEGNGYGLEWRSFNLNGISTWVEFEEMFRIVWVCLEYIFNIKIKGYKTRDTMDISKKLKDIMPEDEKHTLQQVYNINTEVDIPTTSVYLVSTEKKINVPLFEYKLEITH